MKKDIGKIPIFGSFLIKNNLIIERNFILDKNKIINFIKKIDNAIIIIYPEGTRLNKVDFAKSQEYSKNNNLKVYNNLLYPKMKGLHLIINELNKNNKLGNLIDITLKVDGLKKFNTGPVAFLNNIGNSYCYINTYNINTKYINNYNKFKEWYLQIWNEKEKYLDNYYNNIIYKKCNYNIKNSTFILNFFFINLLIFYLLNKKHINKKQINKKHINKKLFNVSSFISQFICHKIAIP